MGMFDDLIPGSGAGFDDLIPAAAKKDPKIGQPEELTFGEKVATAVLPKWFETLRGSAPVRALQGMADPMIGAMQTAANVLPDATGIPQAVNKRVHDLEADYEQQRKARGSEGTDWARLGGNVLSPVNAIPAGRMEAAVSAGGRALQGAEIGAAMAAAAPVADAENGFWGKKTGQIALGGATGGVLTPVLGKVADIAIARFGVGRNPNVRPSSHDVDGSIVQALKEAGQSIDDVPPEQLQALRSQVTTALQGGKTMDAAAALRKSDFDALGMRSLRGQITRDPMEFAREQNLRGVEGVGDELSAVLSGQGRDLHARLPAGGGKPEFQAGTQLSESLAGIDDKLRKHVSGLYGEARASAGKDLDVPLHGLAQDYARVVNDFADNVPTAIRQQFAALGLDPAMPSNQRKVFTLENANTLLQTINKNDPGYANPPMSKALTELRGAVRSAIEGADPSGGPFAPAVKAAAERFKMHDAIPALKAASDGSVAPDDFVRRFVVNGKTNEVKGLANVLKQADPPAYQEARAQIADELRRAAFGADAAGDAPFSSARYMATIRRLGPDKLGAFFSAQEVGDIMRVGRVGTYIKQAPDASAVNRSNTTSAALNALTKLPGLRQAGAVINNVARPIQNQNALRSALAAEVPTTDAPLNAEQINFLRYILMGGGAGGGLAGSAVQ